MSLNLGTLWIVATPLGNPGDLSPRAKTTLAEVAAILAEDTRRTGILLAQCGIQATQLISFHDHNEEAKTEYVVQLLEEGKSLALVSDAGTPLLSDPGFKLVRACRQRNIPVSPLPGPSAPIAALSASGLPPLPFAFLGFAPRKHGEQETFFGPYRHIAMTLIFFDRKDRIQSTLTTAYSILGDREVCIAREITKTYEEFLYCTLATCSELPELLGEITVIIGPTPLQRLYDKQAVQNLIRQELTIGGKPKEIIRRVQSVATGWSSKELYQLLHEMA